MTLPKLTHAATLVSRHNRQRILDALPATQQELQDRLYLSRACVSRHICALKADKAIHITAYTKPTSRGVGAGSYIETYSVGNKPNVKRPPLFDDTAWQRKNRNPEYAKRQRDLRFLRSAPKSDPLAVMYARNEQNNLESSSRYD